MTQKMAWKQNVIGKKFLSNEMQGVIPVIHTESAPFYVDQIAGYDLQVESTPAAVFPDTADCLCFYQQQGFGCITVTQVG